MPTRHVAPSPLLLEGEYWRGRLARLDSVPPGLLILPRPDLCIPGMEVVEWRLRAHDGLRLWGLRCQSSFHTVPKAARIRLVESCQRPEPEFAAISGGEVDFVYQVPAGRRLEDRVLDCLRVFRVAADYGEIEPQRIRFDGSSDEFMITAKLVGEGIY